jgi:hypothetical protein
MGNLCKKSRFGGAGVKTREELEEMKPRELVEQVIDLQTQLTETQKLVGAVSANQMTEDMALEIISAISSYGSRLSIIKRVLETLEGVE